MTPIEFQRKLEAKIADLETAKLIFPIAAKVHDMQIDRLFDEGVGGQGKLGKYSTDENYFTKKQFKNKSAFKASGKNAKRSTVKYKSVTVTDEDGFTTNEVKKTGGGFVAGSGKFKNGNERKSMYLKEGYKQLRQIQGMESGFVNLQYSKDLRNDFSTGLKIKGDKVISVVKRKVNDDKTDWLSDKYGAKTFNLTEKEKEFFIKETSKELANYFKN